METHGFQFVLSTFLLTKVAAQFFDPNTGCMPMMMCPLRCPAGFEKDSRGCQICRCASPTGVSSDQGVTANPMNPGGDPFHQGGAQMSMSGILQNFPTFSATYHKPCINDTVCDLKCDDGYYNGPDGCQFCLCASQADDVIFAILSLQYKLTTTPKPEAQTTLSPGECLQKITECQLKYPYGFMTDDSCTMCISKDDIYPAFITEEHQPMIRLTNPCIQGFDVCRIFCATGYRTGPRSCQYCACNG